MITSEQAQTLVGTTVHSQDMEKIGKVGQVYFDDATGQAAWVTVQTGLFGTKETFVPIEGASMHDDELMVPFTKDKVKNAPSIDVDSHLSETEEAELYRYYGVAYEGGYEGTTGTDTYETGGTDTYATGTTDTYATGTTGDDDAMTLSEEQVRVGTERREAGRVRLRKYVVTENVTKTVPVTREEVRIEREPITDANRGDALSGPEISEAEHEVVLHEEVPVVQKDTVPVERVRLDTETVTSQETVTEQVRHEEIDTDGDSTLR